MEKFFVICYKSDGLKWVHDYAPTTKFEALGVGHELTRDYVCVSFKVIRCSTPPGKEY